MIHVLLGSGLLIGLLVGTLLPFAPGKYDVAAVPISSFAQALGLGSLLAAPIALTWWIHGLRHRPGDAAADRVRHRYATAVLAVLAFVGLFAALMTGAQWGLSLGAVLACAWLACVIRGFTRSRARASSAPGPDRATPLLCLLVPGLYLIAWIQLADPAAALARARAIRSSAPLIADIEAYRAARGSYPLSLQSLWGDYDPGVMGIDRYRYEPHGEAYNLFFEQPTLELGASVIVMYNPRDEQAFSSHDSDLLLLSPEDVERQRGFFAVQAAPEPHWKSFLFD